MLSGTALPPDELDRQLSSAVAAAAGGGGAVGVGGASRGGRLNEIVPSLKRLSPDDKNAVSTTSSSTRNAPDPAHTTLSGINGDDATT